MHLANCTAPEVLTRLNLNPPKIRPIQPQMREGSPASTLGIYLIARSTTEHRLAARLVPCNFARAIGVIEKFPATLAQAASDWRSSLKREPTTLK